MAPAGWGFISETGAGRRRSSRVLVPELQSVQRVFFIGTVDERGGGSWRTRADSKRRAEETRVKNGGAIGMREVERAKIGRRRGRKPRKRWDMDGVVQPAMSSSPSSPSPIHARVQSPFTRPFTSASGTRRQAIHSD